MAHTRIREPGGRAYRLQCALAILGALMLLLGGVVIIISSIYTSSYLKEQRLFIGSESTTTDCRGIVTLNSDDGAFVYDIKYATSIGAPVSVFLMGPIDIDTKTGPVFVPLCGTPSLVACDLSVANTVAGTVSTISPSGTGATAYVADVRANPTLYFFQVNNATHSTGSGACRSNLVALSGA